MSMAITIQPQPSPEANTSVRQRGGSRQRLACPTRLDARLAALVIATTLALAATNANASGDAMHKYRMLAPGLHWSGNTMSWYYAPDGQPAWANSGDMVTVTQQAMAAWSSQCGVQFSYLGSTPKQATVEDGASIIGWLPTMSTGANTSWYMRNGSMVEADIQMNVGTSGNAAAAYPLILHEIGHAIGLDHSAVRDAVMAGPPASPGYSYATTLNPDDVAGCQALYGPPHAGAVPTQQIAAADTVAAEFYHPGLDQYFMTADPVERAGLEKGGPDGQWRATGVTFPVWKLAYPKLQAMCRFYGDWHIDPATGKRKGPDSHFYTADPYECAGVPQRWPVWVFEGNAFFAAVPEAGGACPAGTQPVYRYFRPSGDPNHRYVTSDAIKQEMTARGWTAEGVAWCAGQ